MLWTSFLAIVAGFALLVWGADRFVIGASATARNLGVSPLIIGLTIVGFGTSAPEMLVSAMAAWAGNPDMGIGNAIGSNITNVGLVLGITALVTPLSIRSETLKREFPLLFAVMLIALALLLDGEMNRYDGIILLIGMAMLVYWMVALGLRERRDNGDPMESEYIDEIPSHMPMKLAIFWLLLGMVVLLGSSRLLVWGSVNVAQWFGVSDLIIGLTIVAIGTSLPELAASVMSALKGEHDIAIGNVLGSNMFNLLAVLGMPGLIQPGATPAELMLRDFPVMIGLTIALFLMGYGFLRPGRISRLEGLLLLAGYLGYLGLLYHALNG
ncbi:MAG: calcium/sodium antiporter [Gammaproteobacteria bacterium]|nr:calcium/sodium antiporter [Gammaproteobacteria bacterium]MCW8839429.1 calcium/sodium antiporter [Gammaproteobacteria bacterium]MCW8927470.1 calcium/sodium antiporter [Gammaproteobacteria bacterium]MCW8959171.1 calcium/sodium antiporter [Gammaproteobacteria bacterium]MCW8971895.1 calcium/sodium antiporter [Gammaproteobacteria bacterium]